MSPLRIFNYVQTSTPPYGSTDNTLTRAYNYFSLPSQESALQTTERKTEEGEETHLQQQWITSQTPASSSTQARQTTKSSPKDESGGNLQHYQPFIWEPGNQHFSLWRKVCSTR